MANSSKVPLGAWQGETSDANRLESFSAAGDCAITQKMQVNVEKGRKLWKATKQTQQYLLDGTNMQHTEQEARTRVKTP